MTFSLCKQTIDSLVYDLWTLEAYAGNLGMKNMQKMLRELGERMKDKRFSVAVLGDILCGKSTLINAFLRTPVLPSDIVPTTACINRITYDPQPRARVEHFDGSTEDIDIRDLANYATQEGDKSGNVKEVVVWYPMVYCANNVDIYDTPGLNNSAAMTEATMKVIDRMDIVIFTLMANIPISMSECEFIGEKLLTSNVGRVVFVVTRMGEYTPEQQECILYSVRKRISEMMLAKAERVYFDRPDELEEFKRKLDDIRIFGVDSHMVFEAHINADDQLLCRSGLPALEAALDDMLVRYCGRKMIEELTDTLIRSTNYICSVSLMHSVLPAMDRNRFLEALEKGRGMIEAADKKLMMKLSEQEQAPEKIKAQAKTEFERGVIELKEKIGCIVNTVEDTQYNLKRIQSLEYKPEKLWAEQIVPALNKDMQNLCERICNNVDRAIGLKLKQWNDALQEFISITDDFNNLFSPSIPHPFFSYFSGIVSRICRQLSDGKANVFGLNYDLPPVDFGILGKFVCDADDETVKRFMHKTPSIEFVRVFPPTVIKPVFSWAKSIEDFRNYTKKFACWLLNESLEKVAIEERVNEYIAKAFDAVHRRMNMDAKYGIDDMRKSLQDIREYATSENVHLAQKTLFDTNTYESLSSIIRYAMSIRDDYGLNE